ncbi:hypothetical protein KEM55_005813 [Ascosphaera atra]|nr:hypothetical protein KEM55_005813 [Ascosphaera atra]
MLTLSSIISLILAFFTFVILLTYPAWHTEESVATGIQYRRIPSRAVSQVCLSLCFLATVFILVTVLWQHTASVAAAAITRDFGNGSVKSGVGASAMVLGWFGFALMVIVTVGILIMIMSISWFASRNKESEEA